MKRLLLTFLAFISIVAAPVAIGMVTSGSAAAYDPFHEACTNNPTGNGETPAACQPTTSSDPITGKNGIIAKVINILSFAIGVAAVIMIMIGGFRYITANGDSTALTSARNTILYALIGLVVAVAAQGIILFVVNKL